VRLRTNIGLGKLTPLLGIESLRRLIEGIDGGGLGARMGRGHRRMPDIAPVKFGKRNGGVEQTLDQVTYSICFDIF
jgi:hypothetical protein